MLKSSLTRFAGITTLLILLTGSLSAQSLEGNYQAEGAGPGGADPYSGTVQIKSTPTVSTVQWNLGPDSTYKGLGVTLGNTFAAGYGSTKPFGLVIYLVDGGTLTGAWAQSPSLITGEEILSGPAGLDGTFTITSGKSSAGSTYTGKVAIKKTGDTYALKWTLPNETYTGTGVLLGKMLVVGWSQTPEYGVVAYDITADKLKGIWAAGGSTTLGTETLTKQK